MAAYLLPVVYLVNGLHEIIKQFEGICRLLTINTPRKVVHKCLHKIPETAQLLMVRGLDRAPLLLLQLLNGTLQFPKKVDSAETYIGANCVADANYTLILDSYLALQIRLLLQNIPLRGELGQPKLRKEGDGVRKIKEKKGGSFETPGSFFEINWLIITNFKKTLTRPNTELQISSPTILKSL